MPELPEVESTVRSLKPWLLGRRVRRTRLRYRCLYRRGSLGLGALVDREIHDVDRVGKNAVIRFKPGGILVVNLGMTGHLVACDASRPPQGVRAKHLHGRLFLDGDIELRYYDARRFGHFYVAEQCDFRRDLGIGPDPFAMRPAALRNVLQDRVAPIKSLLLDQRIVSGIGNIYADETLFYARIHPARTGGEVSAASRVILARARDVLGRAIDDGGSTVRDYRRADGSAGGFQHHHAVYGRAGQPCLRCRTPVERIVIGGRGTHFCPKCQPVR